MLLTFAVGGGLIFAGVRLTLLVLQQPDLQLDEAVSVVALVFPPAAVADLVATNIQLALRIQGSDLGVSNRVLLKNVNQTPTEGGGARSDLWEWPGSLKLEMKDSLVELKVVFSDGVRAEGGVVFVGVADDSGFVVETDLKDKSFPVVIPNAPTPLRASPCSSRQHLDPLPKNSLKSPHVSQKKKSVRRMKPQ